MMRLVSFAAALAAVAALACADGAPAWAGDEERRVELAEYQPVVRALIVALDSEDDEYLHEVAADSAAVEQLLSFFEEQSGLVAAARAFGMELAASGWIRARGGEAPDTLFAEFDIPVRTMDPACYEPRETDVIQVGFVRRGDEWRAVYLATLDCLSGQAAPDEGFDLP